MRLPGGRHRDRGHRVHWRRRCTGAASGPRGNCRAGGSLGRDLPRAPRICGLGREPGPTLGAEHPPGV